jgi:hypothetical protein
MKVYKTDNEIIVDRDGDLFLLKEWTWDSFINRRNLFKQITDDLKDAKPDNSRAEHIKCGPLE